MSLTELLTLRPKKDLNECCCAGKQQIDVYRFGSVTTLCPWPAPPLPSLLLRLFLAFFLALLDLCLALLALLVARFFVFLRRKAKSRGGGVKPTTTGTAQEKERKRELGRLN